ncbi:MAG: surface-adhesin E family protein [Pseudomonadota bacterium]
MTTMRRPLWPLPLLALLLISGMAQAAQAVQWSKVRGSGGRVLYLDQRSIADADAGRKAWTLNSYSKQQTSADGKLYRSVKTQHLYACKERTITLLAQTYYPEAMARGEAVGNFKYEQYDAEKVVPGTLGDSAFRLVCRKKR